MTARVGLLVPSSNVTMEIELPALLRHGVADDEVPSFHSARMRMTAVTPEALAAMDAQAEHRAGELSDAQVDVIAYACLVAVMVQGRGAHRTAERRLSDASGGLPVISSAGSLVAAIHALGVERVAMVTPYAPALTGTVIDYLAAEDIEVVDAVSLGVTDNGAVGRLDPANLVDIAARLDRSRAQAVVASACVQMPSLPAITSIRALTGLPTLSAATATAGSLRQALGFASLDLGDSEHAAVSGAST
jgi:maleate isomerase